MKLKLEFEKWLRDENLTRAFWDRGHIYSVPQSIPCTQLHYLVGRCCSIIVPRSAVEFVLGLSVESLIPSWCDSKCSYYLPYVGVVEVEKWERKLSVSLFPEVSVGDLAFVLRFPRGAVIMYRENNGDNGKQCNRRVRIVAVRSDGSFIESVVRI